MRWMNNDGAEKDRKLTDENSTADRPHKPKPMQIDDMVFHDLVILLNGDLRDFKPLCPPQEFLDYLRVIEQKQLQGVLVETLMELTRRKWEHV